MRKTEIAQSIAAVGDRVVQQALYNLFRAVTGDDPMDGVDEGIMGPGPALQSLAHTGIPVGIPSNGTIAADGQLTLNTPLPTTYAGGIWLRFPPGAVSGDPTGGLYWCVMTTAAQGKVYGPRVDTRLGFVGRIGAVATPVVGSDSPYTQTTNADIVLTRFTLPANSIGSQGRMQFSGAIASTNNANMKQFKILMGTRLVPIWVQSNITTGSFTGAFSVEVRARGTGRILTSNWCSTASQNSNPLGQHATNLTVPKDIVVAAQIADATDFLVLEGFGAEVLYANG